MCPREVMDIELEHMDWDKFTTVIDQLTNREDITLTGWGEPFLHPRIFDMVAYCKERGHSGDDHVKRPVQQNQPGR